MAKSIVLSDETINCFGFWVKTSGIDIGQFCRNPVMLYMHQRDTDDPSAVIGRWENIHTEGDKLMATPVFDTDSPKGAEVARKYEQGFLKMASIGIDILETSDSPDDLMVGQARPTVTKCLLREASIVDIGANPNALAIEDEQPHSLMVRPGNTVTLMNPNIFNNEIDMTQTVTPKAIFLALGLSENASEDAAVQRIELLSKKAAQTEELLKQQEMDRQRETAEIINKAIDDGKISKDKVELFTNIADKNGNQVLKETLALMQSPQPIKPMDLINQEPKAEDIPDWDTADRQGRLYDIKQNQPEVFQQMFKAKFGK